MSPNEAAAQTLESMDQLKERYQDKVRSWENPKSSDGEEYDGGYIDGMVFTLAEILNKTPDDVVKMLGL